MNGFFVTGTDTGVGKTVVAAGLTGLLVERGERVAVMKPVETGHEGDRSSWPADALMLATAAGLDPTAVARSQVVPYVFREPLAPLIAAQREGRSIQIAAITRAYERACGDGTTMTVVEGAGGLSVSLTGDVDMAGLAALLQLPILIVARPALGTLNHTFLTVEYARSRGLDVLGIVICGIDPDTQDVAEQTNPAALAARCDIPILGMVPRRAAITDAADAREAVRGGLDVDQLIERITGREATAAPPRVRSSR